MSAYETLTYEVAEQVACITLNRPRYHNAQSRLLLEELDRALLGADRDGGVNVIVLLGAGAHFSAGHDLGTPEELADREARRWPAGIRGWYEYTHETFYANTLRWRNLRKPTVAGVQGYCIFGGWMVASAMDVIFAADDAMFLGSLFQYFNLPWDLHPRKVKELLYESRFIDAREAERLGLVNRVVPAAELRAEVVGWARRIAANDPFVLQMSKAAVNNAEDVQGFTGHTKAAHAFYCLGRLAEADADAPAVPTGYQTGERRRPMVKIALENYERYRAARGAARGREPPAGSD